MRRHPEGKGSDSTMRKTSQGAGLWGTGPSYNFFSLFYWQSVTQMVTTYDMKLVFVQKITFLLRKINKNRGQQSCIVRLQYAPNSLSAGALLGSLHRSHRLYLRGLCLKKGKEEKETRGGEKRWWESKWRKGGRRKERGWERRRGENGKVGQGDSISQGHSKDVTRKTKAKTKAWRHHCYNISTGATPVGGVKRYRDPSVRLSVCSSWPNWPITIAIWSRFGYEMLRDAYDSSAIRARYNILRGVMCFRTIMNMSILLRCCRML